MFLLKSRKQIVTSGHLLEPTAVNTLAQVCKQLGAEYFQPELTSNKVKVQGGMFLKMHTSRDARLRNPTSDIQIHDVLSFRSDVDRALLGSILAFAKTNKNAKVSMTSMNWRFANMHTRIIEFMMLGWTIENAARGFGKRTFPDHKNGLDNWIQRRPIDDRDLLNLRFCTAVSVFNDPNFRYQLQNTDFAFVKKNLMTFFNILEDALVDAVRGWYDEGI